MAVRETTEIDLDRVDALIQEEEAKLEPRHAASIAYRRTAERHVAGGVASSWQDSPPHAIYIERGKGNHIWDIDGNEYLDFHLGYGAMVVGHAHPKIVEAIEGAARNSHYGASKGGLTAYVRALAVELARYQIRVNSILPGWIETEMTARAMGDERFRAAVLPRIPARRWGTWDDFGGIAVYLMSDASAYQTGEQIVIDGGYTKF